MTGQLVALWLVGLGPLAAVVAHWWVTEALARPAAPAAVPPAPQLHRWLPAAPRPHIPPQLAPRPSGDWWAGHAPDWLTGPVGSVDGARWPWEDRPADAIAAERTAA